MKLLLIDANNMAFRVHWTHKNLTHNGMPTSLLYGFFASLISLRKKFPNHFPLVVWDGVYERRTQESEAGVEAGIIDAAYKSNRPKDITDPDYPPDILCVHQQMEPLKEGLKFARVMQVRVEGVEADDVIYTYAKSGYGDSVIVSSDHDYYQALALGIDIYDAMKRDTWTYDIFLDRFGFEPKLWIDAGALMGDKSDHIEGCPGIGEVNASKLIKLYGTVEQVFEGLAAKKKRGKKEQAVLDNQPRIMLGKSLKTMDMIDDLPDPRAAPKSVDPLIEWFHQFGIESLVSQAHRLV